MDRHNCPSPYQQRSNYEQKIQLERDVVRAKVSFDNLKADIVKAQIEREGLFKSIAHITSDGIPLPGHENEFTLKLVSVKVCERRI